MILLDGDVAPIGEPESDVRELRCVTCAIPLTYGGRGPKPKYCEEHRQGNKRVASSPRKSTPTVETLISQIKDTYRQLGMMGMFVPKPSLAADAMIIMNEADKLGESWRGVLERDENIRRMWTKFFTVSGWGTLIAAHAMIALPIMQNHGVIKVPKDVVPPTPQAVVDYGLNSESVS